MDTKLFTRLSKFIGRAENLIVELPDDKIESEINVLEFQNWITQFLDYTYTNLQPDETAGLYYPRPYHGETLQDYTDRLDSNKKQKLRFSNKSKLTRDFLRNAHLAVRSSYYAISLLYPKAKHETEHQLSNGYDIGGSSRDNILNLVTHLNDGSIDINGTVHIEGNSTGIVFNNSSFNGVKVDNLTIDRNTNKNVALETASGAIVNLPFIVWAERCVETCKAILHLLPGEQSRKS